MEEKVGFEPTDAFTPTVFKTVPLNRTLAPLLEVMAVGQGFEPWEPGFARLNGLANRRFRPLSHPT
jgi:hypothetical protein